MYNPIFFSLRFQQAALRNARYTADMMTDTCLRLIEQQQRLLLHQAWNRRSEDSGGKCKPQRLGGDLLDHYGRRCHDVDVEQI